MAQTAIVVETAIPSKAVEKSCRWQPAFAVIMDTSGEGVRRLSYLDVRFVDKSAKALARMRQEFLMISGVTKADRHQVTADVNDAISSSGGWVVNHTMFSNIAITIQFSLPSQRLDELRDRVMAASVKLDDDSLAKIRAMGEKRLPKAADVTATLNITFIHDEPDLRREIPAVPG